MKIKILVVMALVIAFLSACSAGLSTPDRVKAEKITQDIKFAADLINQRENEYVSFVQSTEYADYRFYAERGNWANNFGVARETLAAAQLVNDQQIKKILRRNDAKEADALREQVASAEKLLELARSQSDILDERKRYIQYAKKNYATMLQQAAASIDSTTPVMKEMQVVYNNAKAEFPLRNGDLDTRINPIMNSFNIARGGQILATREIAKLDKKEFVDWETFADQAILSKKSGEKILETGKEFMNQVKSLPLTTAKTLADMKVDYTVEIQRSSWNDSLDSPSIHEFKYQPVAISDEDYDVLDAIPDSTDYIAKLSRSFGGGDSMSYNIDQGLWNRLGIAPRDSWPDATDDTAEFGFTLAGKYFHKYYITQNDVVTETDWVPVDEQFFGEYVDDLGMDIESKAYGQFQDETYKTVAPAGLAFVGNPRYGEWKTDESGNRFWEFYVQYMLLQNLFGNQSYAYRYREDEYNRWNSDYRGKKDYYGADPNNPEKERYGTSGVIVGGSGRYSSRINSLKNYSERHSPVTVNGRGPGGARGK